MVHRLQLRGVMLRLYFAQKRLLLREEIFLQEGIFESLLL